ncbi:MAG: alpha/beta fold hydrolase [Anaerolineae bacterium]|nr:MAG: alpha/beta fold hydrolase [Anaerolineae bacterium]
MHTHSQLILPTAEPFFFPGGEHGCLLIHGFTGTPKEMRPLGERLAARGYTVLGIRLAGHATTPDDMRRSTWRHWAASVEDGYHLLRGITTRIALVGLSMGGVLALYTASRLPVDAVAALATPHHLPDDPRLKILPLLALLRPYDPKGEPQWVDPEAVKDLVTYPVTPTRAYGELLQLLAAMRAGLPQVTAPTLLLYSRQDPVVQAKEGHMQAFAAALQNAASLTQHWVEGSGHILPADAQRETVAEIVGTFLHTALQPDKNP